MTTASIFDFEVCNRRSPNPSLPVERRIFNAVCRRDLCTVKKILQESVCKELDLQLKVNGFNCAHIAARKGCTEILAAILTYDENLVSSTTEDNNRTLHMLAAFEDQLDTLKFLCNFSASRTYNDPNRSELISVHKSLHEQVDIIGNSLLHYSVWGGSLRCTSYLVETCGLKCTCLNYDKLTPLQMASAGNHHEIVSYLILHTTQNTSDDTAPTAAATEEVSIGGLNSLHRAAIYGSIDVLKLLISPSNSSSLHFDVDTPTLNGTTALHLAAKHGHWDTLTYLVDHGHASVDQANHFGLTALHFACIG